MRRYNRGGMLIAGCLLFTAGPVLAQPPAMDTPPPPAPVLTQPAAAPSPVQLTQSAFPDLPASRPCDKRQVLGLWKLKNVYEAPQGSEMAGFASNPLQYVLFKPDDTYGKFNAGFMQMKPPQVRKQIIAHTTGLQQYLVHESGVIFFYQDSVSSDSQACFIVALSQGPFVKGQMLLMPPQGKIPGRLVKVYGKVAGPAKAAPKKGNKKGKGKNKNQRNKNRNNNNNN